MVTEMDLVLASDQVKQRIVMRVDLNFSSNRNDAAFSCSFDSVLLGFSGPPATGCSRIALRMLNATGYLADQCFITVWPI
jgi:hypothetical protein